MELHVCRLARLSPNLVYKIFRLRQEVFIVEQQGICHDIDDADLSAWHVFALGPDADLIGYCRLSEKPIDFWRLQRVVVAPNCRRKGVAAALLSEAIGHARQLGAPGITLNAQLHALSIYLRQGFATASAVYDDGGTPHMSMRLSFS